MRPDEVEKMRCRECGSEKTGIDKNLLRYCRDCGVVFEELLMM